MKIIFSPSKSMKCAAKELMKNAPEPTFIDKTLEIVQYLKGCTKDELGALLKIKGKVLEDTYLYYQNFGQQKHIAIELFSGTSFKELTLSDWTFDEKKFAQDHLIILDALYGIIKPFDVISKYRLDYSKTVKDNKKYFANAINELLKDEDIIIDLASKEYSSLIKHKNIVRLDTDGLNSVAAKRLRGKTLNEYIKGERKW